MFEATGLAARELAQKLKAGLGKTSLKAVPSSQEKLPRHPHRRVAILDFAQDAEPANEEMIGA
jgi:hypothetical protein